MDEVDSPEKSRSRPDAPASKTAFGVGLAMLALLCLLTILVVYKQTPPRAVDSNAPANTYSSGRALKHLEVISRSPHPVGSVEHAAVRDYIVRELSALGLQPEVQQASVVNSRGSALSGAVVNNIAARLKGTGGGGKALLIAGHYDTVPNAPGASDDGSSVATMLEMLRALKAGAPLRNDVIFLFTDGEELGLFGAKAFVDEHPWAKDVGLVLNFEARGAGGPVVMFETSDENGWLVREFAKAAPAPVGNSLLYEIYKLLPNDTDLSVFKAARLPGLNFAYIDGFQRYHTQADNIENLDERSLQHQGSYALALAQHFGAVDLTQTKAANAVYFDLLGTTMLSYPSGWILPLTALALILFIAVLVLGLRRARLTVKGIIAGFLLFVLNLVVTSGVVYLIWRVIAAVQLGSGRSLIDDFYRSKLYFVGFVLVAVAVNAALYNFFRRRARVENLYMGALACWLLLLVLTSMALPGGSYLLMWPLLFALVGLGVEFASREWTHGSVKTLVILAVCAVVAVVLVVPVIYQSFVALGLGEVELVVPLVVLLCGLLIPHFALMGETRRRWWLPAGALVVALCFIAAAIFNPGFSKQYPTSNHIFYVLNADTGKAAWASADDATDEWTGQFFPSNTAKVSLKEYVPLSANSYRINPAPAVSTLAPAGIQLVSNTTQGDVRTLRLRVTPMHAGISVAVPREANVEVVSAEINGKRVESGKAKADGGGQSPSSWSVQFWAPPREGFDLVLEVKGAQTVPLKVVEQAYGLPEIPGTSFRPRPEHIIPSSFINSNFSLVTKSHTF